MCSKYVMFDRAYKSRYDTFIKPYQILLLIVHLIYGHGSLQHVPLQPVIVNSTINHEI